MVDFFLKVEREIIKKVDDRKKKGRGQDFMEYIAREFIRDVDRKCKAKFRVDENIGWLDKISITSPTGKVTGGIL